MQSVEKARRAGVPSGKTPTSLGLKPLRFMRIGAVRFVSSKNVKGMQ
jgi:hypothetical protein